MSWHRSAFVGSLAAAACVAAACSGSTATPPTTATRPATTANAATTARPVPAQAGLAPRGETLTGLTVTRVVDGDTIHVDVAGEDVTVRLIGIDTPETVQPDTPVACFGPEASQFAQDRLTGQRVTLEFDEAQDRQDRYGRTLAYVWIEGDGAPTLFNLEAVQGGFAEELQYGPRPGTWQAELRTAEEQAVGVGRGRWGTCAERPRS